MLKFCVEQWDKNKSKLEEDIRKNIKEYNDFGYKTLVEKVVDLILNDEESDYGDKWDSKNITEIDNGDYQGTLLYLIPLETYQPSEGDYLTTFVGYGSCSGCDTLQSIQIWYWDDEEEIDQSKKDEFVNDIMKLCLNLVQNIIRPYNYGWRHEDKYTNVEEK